MNFICSPILFLVWILWTCLVCQGEEHVGKYDHSHHHGHHHHRKKTQEEKAQKRDNLGFLKSFTEENLHLSKLFKHKIDAFDEHHKKTIVARKMPAWKKKSDEYKSLEFTKNDDDDVYDDDELAELKQKHKNFVLREGHVHHDKDFDLEDDLSHANPYVDLSTEADVHLKGTGTTNAKNDDYVENEEEGSASATDEGSAITPSSGYEPILSDLTNKVPPQTQQSVMVDTTTQTQPSTPMEHLPNIPVPPIIPLPLFYNSGDSESSTMTSGNPPIDVKNTADIEDGFGESGKGEYAPKPTKKALASGDWVDKLLAADEKNGFDDDDDFDDDDHQQKPPSSSKYKSNNQPQHQQQQTPQSIQANSVQPQSNVKSQSKILQVKSNEEQSQSSVVQPEPKTPQANIPHQTLTNSLLQRQPNIVTQQSNSPQKISNMNSNMILQQQNMVLTQPNAAMQQTNTELQQQNRAIQQQNMAFNQQNSPLQNSNTEQKQPNIALQQINKVLEQPDMAHNQPIIAQNQPNMIQKELIMAKNQPKNLQQQNFNPYKNVVQQQFDSKSDEISMFNGANRFSNLNENFEIDSESPATDNKNNSKSIKESNVQVTGSTTITDNSNAVKQTKEMNDAKGMNGTEPTKQQSSESVSLNPAVIQIPDFYQKPVIQQQPPQYSNLVPGNAENNLMGQQDNTAHSNEYSGYNSQTLQTIQNLQPNAQMQLTNNYSPSGNSGGFVTAVPDSTNLMTYNSYTSNIAAPSNSSLQMSSQYDMKQVQPTAQYTNAAPQTSSTEVAGNTAYPPIQLPDLYVCVAGCPLSCAPICDPSCCSRSTISAEKKNESPMKNEVQYPNPLILPGTNKFQSLPLGATSIIPEETKKAKSGLLTSSVDGQEKNWLKNTASGEKINMVPNTEVAAHNTMIQPPLNIPSFIKTSTDLGSFTNNNALDENQVSQNNEINQKTVSYSNNNLNQPELQNSRAIGNNFPIFNNNVPNSQAFQNNLIPHTQPVIPPVPNMQSMVPLSNTQSETPSSNKQMNPSFILQPMKPYFLKIPSFSVVHSRTDEHKVNSIKYPNPAAVCFKGCSIKCTPQCSNYCCGVTSRRSDINKKKRAHISKQYDHGRTSMKTHKFSYNKF